MKISKSINPLSPMTTGMIRNNFPNIIYNFKLVFEDNNLGFLPKLVRYEQENRSIMPLMDHGTVDRRIKQRLRKR